MLPICASSYAIIYAVPLSFFKRRSPSSVTNTLLSDMVYTDSVFSIYIYEMVASFLIPVILWVSMATLDWRLAIGSLCIIGLALPFLFASYRAASADSPKFIDAKAKVDHTLLEYIEGIRELKGANLTGAAFRPFVKHNDYFQRMSLVIERRFGLFGQTYMGILELVFVLTFILGAFFYAQGSLSLLMFIFFLCLANRLVEPLQLLGAFLTEFRFALGAVDRVAETLDEKTLPIVPAVSERTGHSFTFTDVSFSYGEKQALKSISFHAPEGSVTALVGQSGSGKTTIANLLLRFWDVGEGSICIGGRDIRSLSKANCIRFSALFFKTYTCLTIPS